MRRTISLATILFVLLATSTLAINNLPGDLPLTVVPLANGSIQPGTTFNYNWTFANDVSCTSLLTVSDTVQTNAYGRAFIDLNISGLNQTPKYLCEYRNGALRTIHTLNPNQFGQTNDTQLNASIDARINLNPSGYLTTETSWIGNSSLVTYHSELTTCGAGNYSYWNGTKLLCGNPSTGAADGTGGWTNTSTNTSTNLAVYVNGSAVCTATNGLCPANTTAQMIAAVNNTSINILGNAATATTSTYTTNATYANNTGQLNGQAASYYATEAGLTATNTTVNALLASNTSIYAWLNSIGNWSADKTSYNTTTQLQTIFYPLTGNPSGFLTAIPANYVTNNSAGWNVSITTKPANATHADTADTATSATTASSATSATYAGTATTANNSLALNGHADTYFLTTTGTAADSNKLNGQVSTYYWNSTVALITMAQALSGLGNATALNASLPGLYLGLHAKADTAGNADTVTNGVYTNTIVGLVGNWSADKTSYSTTAQAAALYMAQAGADASNITTGTFADARIASASTWNAKASTGSSAACTYGVANFTVNAAGVPTVTCAAAQGDITGVTAGTGLTGGGSSGSVTLTLNTSTKMTNATHADTADTVTNGVYTNTIVGLVGNYSADAAAIAANISAVNATAQAKASPGTCSAGTVVQNTTTSGVQCITPTATGDGTGGWTNDSATTNTSLNVNIANNLTMQNVTAGEWRGTKIAVTYGGTGLTSVTDGDILYAASGGFSKLSIGSANKILASTGGAPTWTDSPVLANVNTTGNYQFSGTTGNVSWSDGMKVSRNSTCLILASGSGPHVDVCGASILLYQNSTNYMTIGAS